jgi:hypothetical protein
MNGRADQILSAQRACRLNSAAYVIIAAGETRDGGGASQLSARSSRKLRNYKSRNYQ